MNHRFCFLVPKILCCTVVFLTQAYQVAAAEPGADADRAQLTQSQAPGITPGLDDGRAVATPNDPDLGEQQILKRAEQYQPFTASIGAPFYWTSNVALTSSGEEGDFIVAPVAGLYYQPKLGSTLYGLLSVREQQFFYSEFDSFDFGSLDLDAGLTYIVPKFHNLVLRGQYNFNRLSDDDFDNLFSNHALLLNAEIPFRFGRAQRVSVGANFNLSFAGVPERPRRSDYEAYLGYSLGVTRALTIDAVGRIVVRDYVHQDDRVDVSEVLAFTASYRVMQNFTASFISTFAANQSDHESFDYEVGNVGGAVSLSIKF